MHTFYLNNILFNLVCWAWKHNCLVYTLSILNTEINTNKCSLLPLTVAHYKDALRGKAYWLLLKESSGRTPVTCPTQPAPHALREAASSMKRSTAESWWSEVTILGHGLNGSNKNRLHSDPPLLRSARERGPIVQALRCYTLKGCLYRLLHVLITYCAFYSGLCGGALHSISIISHLKV